MLRSVPEFHLFETDEQRARGIEELDTELEGSKAFWRAMLIMWLVTIVVANASLCVIPMLVPWRFPGRIPLAIALQLLLAVGLTVWIWRRGIKQRLRLKLIEQGVPVCRGCGYCLRGLPRAAQVQCPECGRPAEADVLGLLGRQ